MDAQSRINAMIAYFFLGPLFLLAKKGTPLGLDYVRSHAARSSIIMGSGLLIILGYIFLLSPIFQFQIFGISVHSIILSILMTILVGYLLHGAYRAYQGVDAAMVTSSLGKSTLTESEAVNGNYSEEEKIRILASYIPFVGVLVAERYRDEPYIAGRKLSTLLAFVIITVSVFFGGTVSTLVFALTILIVIIFIVTAVYLFVYDRWLSFGVYRLIPTYPEIESHIMASVNTIYDFFRVAFGGEARRTYSALYDTYLARYSQTLSPSVPYVLPQSVIAIPVINLITLPSLWRSDMREYRALILQGLTLTLLLGLIIWIYGVNSSIGLYLLFPLMSLLANHGQNILHRAPGTSPIVSLIALLSRGQEQLQAMGEKKEEVSFTYEEKK